MILTMFLEKRRRPQSGVGGASPSEHGTNHEGWWGESGSSASPSLRDVTDVANGAELLAPMTAGQKVVMAALRTVVRAALREIKWLGCRLSRMQTSACFQEVALLRGDV